MTLLQPSYLWGLLALAIPIAIHLWSKKKVRTIKVGSTKYISETKSKQSNSIRLNELLLLALRCLIIGILVFILTEPYVSKSPEQQDIAYVFEPSLLASAEGRVRFTQIPEEGRRLLSPGFPEWQEGNTVADTQEVPNYWQLAKQMNEIPADSVVVFTHAFAKALKGKRPQVQKAIHWIPVDINETISEPFLATVEGDSIAMTTVNSDANSVSFTKKREAKNELNYSATAKSVEIKTPSGYKTIAVQDNEPIHVNLVYDETENAQRVYLEAAFRAIEKYTSREIVVQTIKYSEDIDIEKSDYLIFLSNQTAPDTEIRTLLYRPDTLAKKLIEPGNTSTTYVLTRKLTPQVIIEDHLVTEILEWLELDRDIEMQLDTFDKRTVAVNQLETVRAMETNAVKKEIQADMSGTFWVVLLILLLGERILARIRKQ